jgi:hypothetical protein
MPPGDRPSYGHRWQASGQVNSGVTYPRSEPHFNDGVMPDNDQIFVISEVLRKVARLMTLRILNPSGELLKRSREEGSLWRIHDMLIENELRITHEGKWEHIPKPEQSKLPNGISFGT